MGHRTISGNTVSPRSEGSVARGREWHIFSLMPWQKRLMAGPWIMRLKSSLHEERKFHIYNKLLFFHLCTCWSSQKLPSSVQFSRSVFVTPWITAHQASLSITNSQSLLKLMSIESGDAIQPSHPLSSPSPPALNPSQHQGLFQWVNTSHEVAKVLEFQLQHQSFQWTPRTDLL